MKMESGVFMMNKKKNGSYKIKNLFKKLHK